MWKPSLNAAQPYALKQKAECFFWYRPTLVVPEQRPLNGCFVVVYVVHKEERVSVEGSSSEREG